MAPTATEEHERKLEVTDGFQLPALGERLPTRTFVSTYHDSDDLLLARLGLTLRRRLENGKSVWQLKLPRNNHRLELEAPGGPAASGGTGSAARSHPQKPTAAPGRRTADPAREPTHRRRRWRSYRGRPRHRQRARRTPRPRGVPRGRDRGLEREPGARRPRTEPAAGGARNGDGRSKLLRTLGVSRQPVPLPEAPGAEHFRAAVRAHVISLLAHDPGVRVGDDQEDVHAARVATRRLRALLRAALGSLEEEWAAELTSELRWLGALLGRVRDLDVLLEELRDAAATLDEDRDPALELAKPLEAERRRARRALLTAMRGDRYRSLLDRLEAAAEGPRFRAELHPAAIAAAEFGRLRRAVKRLPDNPTDDELHALRVRGKRARYASELAAGVVGKPAERFVARAKDFQDAIGEHQDAVVAEQRLRDLAGSATPQAAFAAGRLAERQQERRRAAREAWSKSWKRLERSGRRAFG